MNSISSTPQYNLPEEQVLNITNLLFQFLVWTVACVLELRLCFTEKLKSKLGN
jgi:hypothetical protein